MTQRRSRHAAIVLVRPCPRTVVFVTILCWKIRQERMRPTFVPCRGIEYVDASMLMMVAGCNTAVRNQADGLHARNTALWNTWIIAAFWSCGDGTAWSLY